MRLGEVGGRKAEEELQLKETNRKEDQISGHISDSLCGSQHNFINPLKQNKATK